MAHRKELEAPPLEGDQAMEMISQENSSDPEDDGAKLACALLLFYGSQEKLDAVDAANAEKAERRMREAEVKAREAEEEKLAAEERKRLEETAAVWRAKRRTEVNNSIRKYNRKTRCEEYTRFPFKDLSTFDLDEPSPILAMRYTDERIRDCAYLKSINVLSVKIVSSDKDFPLNVYGSIILRDSLDYKCVYLFSHPDRMDSEFINSEEQSLILTGPSRGLLLVDYIYIEVDLKMKRNRGKDKQLSIGLLEIDGRLAPRFPTSEVQRYTLDSSLSTVEVRYAVVEKATEASLEFHVLKGDFKGQITAHTTKIEDSIHDRMLLHDSTTCGSVTSCDGSRVIQLLRRVVAVCVDEMLVFTVSPQGAAIHVERFTPLLNGAEESVFDWGALKLGVKVYWSVVSY